jgi:hypothetical protein
MELRPEELKTAFSIGHYSNAVYPNHFLSRTPPMPQKSIFLNVLRLAK